jgi:hypothetical protein
MNQGFQTIKTFGPPTGAPGVSVIERSTTDILNDPRFGAIAVIGLFKRGPIDEFVPILSRQQFMDLFGDPRDPSWHLYDSGSHLAPDAIDGFFSGSAGAGIVFVMRIDVEDARSATAILRNRNGQEVLKFTAANPGRWGGYEQELPESSVVVATSRTFTLVVPGVKGNEFIEGKVQFSEGSGKTYEIIANTKADEISGEAIFTIAPQYDLVADGVSGPISISGLASYTRTTPLTGSVTFNLLQNIVGLGNVLDRTVTGIGTAFRTEFEVGQNIYLDGEPRQIESITSDTTLTIAESFTRSGNNLTLQKDNLIVQGSGTHFMSELQIGDYLYYTDLDNEYSREIAEIISDTELVLVSGFSLPLSPGTSTYIENYWVVGDTNSNFNSDLSVGEAVINPNRRGQVMTVVEVDSMSSPQRFKINRQLEQAFTNAQLTKQSQRAKIRLIPPEKTGLAVEVGMGVRYPQSHFSLRIYFNGSSVLFVPDASLDPGDSYYVESMVNLANIAYRTPTSSYPAWLTVENLWSGLYTTAKTNDVRPTNGSGEALHVSPQRLYTVGDFDYKLTTSRLLYANPYDFPRGGVRVKASLDPEALEGTISSSGVNVYGAGTVFRSALKIGDYIYDPNTNEARRVRVIVNDNELLLDTIFPTDIPAGTRSMRVGYLSVDPGVDLTRMIAKGDRFFVQYPEYLKAGYDGDTARLSSYNFIKYLDVDRNYLETTVYGRNVGLVRICCPGISDVSVQRAGVEYASQKAFEFRVEIPSYITNAPVAEAYVNYDLELSDFMSVAFPSYAWISNPKRIGDRLISLSGDIMGLESLQSTAVQGYHAPAAGLNARLSRVTRMPFVPSPEDEAILNMAGIQPIKVFSGRTVVFGARGPAANSLYTYLHVRRIQSNYVRIFLEAQPFLQALFKPNQPDLAAQIIMTLENFARREYRKGVYTRYLSFDQGVRVSSLPSAGASGVGGDDYDVIVSVVNGELQVYYSYIPTGILEKLLIYVGPDSITSRFGSLS